MLSVLFTFPLNNNDITVNIVRTSVWIEQSVIVNFSFRERILFSSFRENDVLSFDKTKKKSVATIESDLASCTIKFAVILMKTSPHLAALLPFFRRWPD